MKEKYFEDLGLDDGSKILSKFKINVDDILEQSEKHENKKNKNKEKNFEENSEEE